MNVQPYFLGSPTFDTPPMIVHAVIQPPDPDVLAALMDLWQNPTYPEDSYLTEDQFNAEARTKTMQRAQDPAVMLCLLDEVDSETYPTHGHTYSECMDYRARNIIAPSDPWTYWSLYDKYPFGLPPVIIPPVVPHGWTPIARVNSRGISEMNGWSANWTGYTFVTQIGPSAILTAGYGPGLQTRVIIAADGVFNNFYIGPATSTPFIASALYPLTFGGQTTNIAIDATYSDGGVAMPYTRMSDPLPQGIDAPNGLIISGFVAGPSAGETYSSLQTRGQENDWLARYAYGDHSADLDKSKLSTDWNYHPDVWYPVGVADFAVLMVEGLY